MIILRSKSSVVGYLTTTIDRSISQVEVMPAKVKVSIVTIDPRTPADIQTDTNSGAGQNWEKLKTVSKLLDDHMLQ